MTGKNTPLLNIPPGIYRNSTRYAAGKRWFDANQVRWRNNVLVPIGGWVKKITYSTATTAIRKMHTWKDDLTKPWLAAGSSDKLFGSSYNDDSSYTTYDITPSALGWNPGGITGYGRDEYGSGFYGQDGEAQQTTADGVWSMDNFGRLLTAVHSQDGRLVSWDPVTPSTIAAPVTNAPTGNLLVIATEEEHLMVLGGISNPRRVKWCSRRAITTWTPAEDNSAGGFDIQSNGSIKAAVRVQGGILVITDADVHIIEYVGPPNYYGRRKISDEGGVIGSFAIVPALGGALWLDHTNVWSFLGGAVQKFDCDVQDELFVNSNMTVPQKVHFGINEEAQEVWMMYPDKESSEPNRYVARSYANQPYWAMGELPRTAWINPVWQTKPLAANGIDLYEQENGMLADGVTRVNDVYVETGGLDLMEGDKEIWVDRIYNDSGADMPDEEGELDAFRLQFVLQQAPTAPKRIVGPVALVNAKGYTRVRFRARQFYMRVVQTEDKFWKMGNIRFRIEQRGRGR